MDNISISKTKKYIEEHFLEDLKLDDIAKEMGYSKYHLNRVFQKNTNQSIHQYIRERRLYKAAYLLTNTTIPIIEIALGMGYSSQQSFTFAFKKEFDYTPQSYREKTSLLNKQNGRVIDITNGYFKEKILMCIRGGIAA